MKPSKFSRFRPHSAVARRSAITSLFLGAALVLLPLSSALAFSNPADVGLGTAATFTVLAGSTVTNIGATVISADADVGGNLGVSPGAAVTGFPPGVVTPPGTIHAADATATTAQTDAVTAYNDAASRSPNIVFPPVHDLVGQTFTAGVYNDSSSLALSGVVTLDAEGDPDANFIFQAGSTLITSGSSTVLLTNGAQACHVFWQVGSSATLGANSTFNGTILALTSATIGNGANIQGRVLARNGAVTLEDDTINTPACAPESGVPAAPLFGRWGSAVALAGFLTGAGLFVVRRRMRPAHVR